MPFYLLTYWTCFEKAELLNCPVEALPAPPPPPPAGSTYTFNIVAEGTLSDFDSAKADSIKASIAAKAGVSTSEVTISILAASVYIVVNIKTSATISYGSIANKVDPYLTSASEATELLGGASVVTVMSVVSAPVPYPKPSEDKSDDLPAWAIIVIVVVCVLFVAVLTFASVMYHREKSGNPIFSTLEGETGSKTAKAQEVAMA